MERGVVELTVDEITAANAVLDQLPENTDLALLKQKLVLRNGDTSEAYTIQVTENDAEVLMDNLPTPEKEEDAAITSLRKKMQIFIAQVRFPDQADQIQT